MENEFVLGYNSYWGMEEEKRSKQKSAVEECRQLTSKGLFCKLIGGSDYYRTFESVRLQNTRDNSNQD
jgi:hypothetical protein